MDKSSPQETARAGKLRSQTHPVTTIEHCGAARLAIDELDTSDWQAALAQFDMANIYQTWYYAVTHSRGPFRTICRTALVRDAHVDVIAQFRVKRVPLTGLGIAEADWGPIWDPHAPRSEATLRTFLRFVHKQLCLERGLMVRFVPCSTLQAEADEVLVRLLGESGFELDPASRPYRTIVLDLSLPLEALRRNLHGKWRNRLNAAERANLTVESGMDLEYFVRFYSLYQEMWRHKRFPSGVRMSAISRLHRLMPANERFFISIARQDNQDVAATVCTTCGNTVLYFLGASRPGAARRHSPGYLLQWFNICTAQLLGYRWYDTGGIADNDASGVYRFKTRMNGELVYFPGRFGASPDAKYTRFYKAAEQLGQWTRRLLAVPGRS